MDSSLLLSPLMEGNELRSPAVYGWAVSLNTCAVPPSSIIIPAYITPILSETSATTETSWVMIIIAMFHSCWSFLISTSIRSWVITSSAVVGSSAIMNEGDRASARAIMALCFMPPLNSCG